MVASRLQYDRSGKMSRNIRLKEHDLSGKQSRKIGARTYRQTSIVPGQSGIIPGQSGCIPGLPGFKFAGVRNQNLEPRSKNLGFPDRVFDRDTSRLRGKWTRIGFLDTILTRVLNYCTA